MGKDSRKEQAGLQAPNRRPSVSYRCDLRASIPNTCPGSSNPSHPSPLAQGTGPLVLGI